MYNNMFLFDKNDDKISGKCIQYLKYRYSVELG